MKTVQYSLKQQTAIAVREDLEEALELVEISRKLFQEKLSALEKLLVDEADRNKIEKILRSAEKLYREYKESLKIIETYADQRFQRVSAI